MTAPDQIEITVVIKNCRNTAVKFHLEPWGDEFTMPPQAQFSVIGKGPKDGSGFWVEIEEEAIVVNAWDASVAWIYDNGKEIGEYTGDRPPVPNFSDLK